MKPTKGRIVDYHTPGSADGVFPPGIQPAIVVGLRDGMFIDLCVFYETGVNFRANVPYGTDLGSWSWPGKDDGVKITDVAIVQKT